MCFPTETVNYPKVENATQLAISCLLYSRTNSRSPTKSDVAISTIRQLSGIHSYTIVKDKKNLKKKSNKLTWALVSSGQFSCQWCRSEPEREEEMKTRLRWTDSVCTTTMGTWNRSTTKISHSLHTTTSKWLVHNLQWSWHLPQQCAHVRPHHSQHRWLTCIPWRPPTETCTSKLPKKERKKERIYAMLLRSW